MDIKTRGVISAIINNVFETQNILETINWIIESDDQIVSTEDLALGYMLGSLMNISADIASDIKKDEKLKKWYKKELEKKFGKEEAFKMMMEQKKKNEEIKSKGGRRIDCKLTEEETEKIRTVLIPMISRFREKINQEEALKFIQ
ncbi:MAG: hypothetical protein IBV52_03790 [Candidatus Bathyarchaeota archaeon]